MKPLKTLGSWALLCLPWILLVYSIAPEAFA
jgi:hypothetical protein